MLANHWRARGALPMRADLENPRITKVCVLRPCWVKPCDTNTTLAHVLIASFNASQSYCLQQMPHRILKVMQQFLESKACPRSSRIISFKVFTQLLQKSCSNKAKYCAGSMVDARADAKSCMPTCKRWKSDSRVQNECAMSGAK